MHADPLAQVIESGVLDCGTDDGICNLGALPGEDRPTWLARLRTQFRGGPATACGLVRHGSWCLGRHLSTERRAAG